MRDEIGCYNNPMNTELATFGSGCFWCTEAIFNDIKGVAKVTSGYAGGAVENPTYAEISSGTSGHAEVVQIEFDPSIISYEQLVEVFFLTHNPTTLNRQGHDVGTQYRSIIFYHSPAQQQAAQAVKEKLASEKTFANPIVTEISAFTKFYPAEDYHQNYFANNPDQPYCQAVIDPKVAAARQKFKSLFKH